MDIRARGGTFTGRVVGFETVGVATRDVRVSLPLSLLQGRPRGLGKVEGQRGPGKGRMRAASTDRDPCRAAAGHNNCRKKGFCRR